MIPELVGWAVPIAALAGVLAMVALIVVRGRRVRARRRRQRRVLDELDELGATSVHVTKPVPGQGDPEDLGPAHLARRKDSLVRRRSQFLIAPERVRGWPAPAGQTVLVRFELRGVRHELRCRLEGRSRLTKLGQRRLNLKTGVLFRLAPAGVIVRRERRDMMRFYVGEDGTSLPRGVTDARRFVDMQAWLWTTDLDSAVARTRLSAGDFLVLPPASSRSSDHVSTPEWGPPGETGLAVEVLDFSGGGLQIEGVLTDLANLLPPSGDDDEIELLARRADHVPQIALALQLTSPPSVEDLEPPVSPFSRNVTV